MKKLYLLRHADALRPIGVDDHNRPLSEKGKQACKKMGAYLIENKTKPEVVLCSDALRTMTTGKLVFAATNDINISANKKLYNASTGEILKEISKIPDNVNSIMIIGHNPGIQELAFMLAGEGKKESLMHIKIDYPPCALAQYSFNIEKWEDISPWSGALERFVK